MPKARMFSLYCSACNKERSVWVLSGVSPRCPVCGTYLKEIPNSASKSIEKTRQERVSFQESKGSTSVLGWGIFLLIVGVIGYILSAPKMDVIRSGFGMLAAGFSESTAREFTLWQYAYYGSIVLIVLGGLLFIAGIIQRVQKK